MKLKEIIDQININDDSDHVGITDLAQELDLDEHLAYDIPEQDLKLKAFYLGKHYCTDQEVGIKAYFLNNKFVCLSNQIGRKYDEEFKWVSKNSAKMVKDHLLSLMKEEDHFVDILDLNTEMGAGYPVEYSGQLMNKKVMYKNELVEVISQPSKINGEMNFHTITIKTKEEEMDVDIRDCIVPWNQKD